MWSWESSTLATPTITNREKPTKFGDCVTQVGGLFLYILCIVTKDGDPLTKCGEKNVRQKVRQRKKG